MIEKKKTTLSTFKLDLENLPQLTSEEAAHLDALPINYKDIPQIPVGFWDQNRPAKVDNKAQITLRLDQEVLDYFRSRGSRYQTRINAVLRAFVEAQLREPTAPSARKATAT